MKPVSIQDNISSLLRQSINADLEVSCNGDQEHARIHYPQVLDPFYAKLRVHRLSHGQRTRSVIE
jgi:hypothetical protein